MKELESICNPIIAEMDQGAGADMAGGMNVMLLLAAMALAPRLRR